MKRISLLIVAFACGLLATSSPVFAQSAPDASNWFAGATNLFLLGRDNVDSSKFQEYREVAKGGSMPVFSLQGRQNGKDFAIFGQNIARSDQRYSAFADVGWVDVTFHYNQIPHNMGNDGRTFLSETAPGVWVLNSTLRGSLGGAVDAVSSSARTYPLYANLLSPTIASAGYVDLSSRRNRGDVALDFGGDLPFVLAVTYMRELKSGARGASGGDVMGVVTSAVDVPEPLNEITQDFGVRGTYTFKTGNVYAAYNRNLYNNRVDALIIDNPFRATDLAYVSTSVPGGPGQVRFSTSPDNEAGRAAFGVQLKFKRQTRVTADLAFGRWTQNAQFLPFTINSAILVSGTPATSTALLPRQSLDGKIDTTNVNVGLSSRPVEDLTIRLRFRSYELTNKTSPIDWTGGSTSGSPDRSWGTENATADAPYGFATANLYDNKTARFDAQVSYDIQDLTLEGSFRNAQIDRTSREATSGDDNGYALAAVYHAKDWLGFRGVYDRLKRTAHGTTTLGFQADEADRETTRTGVDIELTVPSGQFGVTFAYFRRNDDYTNRPNRIALSGGVPVAGAQRIPGTPSGLLEAKFDTFTAGFDFTPSARAQLNFYYTYEKNAQTNQWATTTGVNLNNLLNYAGSDKGDTFGLNGVFQLVPEKWTFSLMALHQKVDGLMDITANATGSFSTGRATLNPPGPQDITALDDTKLTTALAELAYALDKSWTFSVGYAYDKYTHADAYSDGTTILPQSVLFFLKANDGNYKVNQGFTRLTYRW